MKKTFIFGALASMMLFATSCQEELPVVEPGGEAVVSFNIEAPQLATRAFSKGDKIDNLKYAVYDHEKNIITDASLSNYTTGIDFTKAGTTLNLTLTNGSTYTIILWASDKDNTAYTLNFPEKKVTVSYEGANCNDESRDAFFADYTFTVNGSQPVDITLTRPFAQLNIGTNDLDESTIAKYTVTHTAVVANAKVPNVFHLLGDENDHHKVEGEVAATFALSKMPAAEETFPVEGYNYLAMNYVLANDVQETLIPIVTLKYSNDGTTTRERSFGQVPLRRNYRTNIYGSLLTNGVDVNVDINPDFNDEEYNKPVLWDGETLTQPAFDEQTNTYTVYNAEELAWIAALVNGTLENVSADNLSGKTIQLACDIELNNKNWTPIGFNSNEEAGNEPYFAGTFDGQGHSINDLRIDETDKGGVGLFGAVHNATFKKFTLNNVYIKAVESESNPSNQSGAQGAKNYIVGGHIGAVAGYGCKVGIITFEDIDVRGLIQIEGETRAAQGQRVGGILGGRSSSEVNFTNITVKGNEGSYIKGYCSVAGVAGQTQGVTTFTNVTTDIDVYAETFGAGGIVGIVAKGSTFTNCSTAGDVTLDPRNDNPASYSANYFYRIGGIAGCWSDSKDGVLTLVDCSYTGALNSYNKEGESPEMFDYAGYVGRGYTLTNCAGSKVIVNGVEYVQKYNDQYGIYIVDEQTQIKTVDNLKEAIADGGDFILISDIELAADESLTIANGKEVNLDLNGKKISQENTPTSAHALINIKAGGTLTISDNSESKLGCISYADISEYTADVSYASNTIRNEGTLIVEGGTIENATAPEVKDFSYPHAIDVYQGSTTTIKGGTIKSANYDCIRMFCNSTTQATTVNIEGGNIINRVSFQNPTSNQAGYGELNISGGIFTTTDDVNANIRLLNFSSNVSNMKATVTGGTFDKGAKTQNYSSWTADWSWLIDANNLIKKIN